MYAAVEYTNISPTISAPTVAALRRGDWIIASTASAPSEPPTRSIAGRMRPRRPVHHHRQQHRQANQLQRRIRKLEHHPHAGWRKLNQQHAHQQHQRAQRRSSPPQRRLLLPRLNVMQCQNRIQIRCGPRRHPCAAERSRHAQPKRSQNHVRMQLRRHRNRHNPVNRRGNRSHRRDWPAAAT